MCIYKILIRSGQIGINRSLCVAVRLFWGFDGLLIHLFSVLYMTTYAKGHQYGLSSFIPIVRSSVRSFVPHQPNLFPVHSQFVISTFYGSILFTFGWFALKTRTICFWFDESILSPQVCVCVCIMYIYIHEDVKICALCVLYML